MSNTFNLTTLIKEAMGYKNVRYRSEYMWFDLEEVKTGQNQAWESWKRINPTLETVEIECLQFDSKMLKEFGKRFGLPPEEIRKFFKVWIGYNPNWGAYLCSIGPYVFNQADPTERGQDLKAIDRANRFSFFTKRFQRADESTVRAAYNKYVDEKLSRYRDILDASDVTFDLKTAAGIKPDGKTDWRTTSMEVDSPEMQQVMTSDEAPFIGAGSQINLNAKGLSKVLKKIAEDYGEGYLQQAIEFVSRKRGISPDMIRRLLDTGEWDAANAGSRRNANPKTIITDLFDSFQSFFPLMIKRQAQDGGWNDILDRAVNLTVSEGVAGVTDLSPDRVWQILGGNIGGDTTNPTLQPARYSDSRQQVAAETLRNTLMEKLIDNIEVVKDQIRAENKIRVKNWKGVPKDTEESAANKRAILERIDSIQPIPILQSLGKKSSGAQRPIALGVRTSHKSLLALKKEILTHLASQQDPNQPIDLQQIARLMTEARRGSRAIAQGGEWTEQDVTNWLEAVQDEIQEAALQGRQITFSDLLEQTDREIEDLNNEQVLGSFQDFDTACRMASIYFMEADYKDIDPGTRAVKSINYRRPVYLFGRDEGAPNMSSQQLSMLRESQDSQQEVPATSKATATPEQINTQIGEIPEMPPVTVDQPQEEQAPVAVHEDEEERGLRTISVKNTLRTLMKIAEELDDAGKLDAAEEIHTIIRKYLG